MRRPGPCIVMVGLAAALATGSAMPADARTILDCTTERYQPRGRTSETTLRSWLPEELRLVLDDDRSATFVRGSRGATQARIDIDNEYKAVIVAIDQVTDSHGRATNMTYRMTWFRSNDSFAIAVEPQGYAELGSGRGSCTARSIDASASVSDGGERRALAVRWDGVAELLAGTIALRQGRREGAMAITMPGGDGICAGDYRFTGGNRGAWQISCPGGLTARGSFEAHGAGKGSHGEGVDNRGRAIDFTIGAR